jgi:hypothetical protein
MARNYLNDYNTGLFNDAGDYSIYDNEEVDYDYDEENYNHISYKEQLLQLEIYKNNALQKSLDIEKPNMTDEEYSLFVLQQLQYIHEMRFRIILKEIIDYVKPMIEARNHFYECQGMKMNSRLLELERTISNKLLKIEKINESDASSM